METRVPHLWRVIITFLALSMIFVLIRIVLQCGRGKMDKKGFWIDDAFIVAAEVTIFVGSLAKLLGSVKYGNGSHMADLSDDVNSHLDLMLMYWYITQILYFLALGLIKISILFFYLRLAENLRRAVYWVLAFVAPLAAVTVLTSTFQCTPRSYFWNRRQEGGCIDSMIYNVIVAVLSVISDIIIYVLPMRTLWKAQLPKSQRVGLIFVFALGGFVVVTGIFRVHALTLMNRTKDPTWANVPSQIWSQIELNVAVICASLPSVKPVLTRIVGLKLLKHGSGKQAMPDQANDGSGRWDAKRNPFNRFWSSRLDTQRVAGDMAAAFKQTDQIDTRRDDGDLKSEGVGKTSTASASILILTTRTKSESEVFRTPGQSHPRLNPAV